MTANDFRRLALGFPDATEAGHMGHPDFRVGGKIPRGEAAAREAAADTTAAKGGIGHCIEVLSFHVRN